jgi:uncharacterized protein YjiK
MHHQRRSVINAPPMTMTTTIRAALAAIALAACAPPPAPPPPEVYGESLFAAAPAQRWALPQKLKEISGLAVSPDGRVFAHDDEIAIVYELNVESGRLVSNFALGDPIEVGDFEGVAISPAGVFWMVTATGQIYRFNEGDDGAHVAFERFESGLTDVCEIEGLAYAAAEESLILACKANHARDMRNTISLYRWRQGMTAAQPLLSIPEAPLAQAAGVHRFRPSGIEFDGASGRILLLSGNDGALVELDPRGRVLSARALGDHQQAEGVTVAPDGALLISDEGPRGPGQLTRFERLP